MTITRLALFDLDHTLLSGDSDVLWLDFLVDRGMLPADIRARNREMAGQYAAGTVDAEDYYALLSLVRRPVVVDPDPRLEATARRKGWTVLRLNRGR